MDFQSEKSFEKLRLRAFQPYHWILCTLKHVERVESGVCSFYTSSPSKYPVYVHNVLTNNFLNIQRIFNPKQV